MRNFIEDLQRNVDRMAFEAFQEIVHRFFPANNSLQKQILKNKRSDGATAFADSGFFRNRGLGLALEFNSLVCPSGAVLRIRK